RKGAIRINSTRNNQTGAERLRRRRQGVSLDRRRTTCGASSRVRFQVAGVREPIASLGHRGAASEREAASTARLNRRLCGPVSPTFWLWPVKAPVASVGG